MSLLKTIPRPSLLTILTDHLLDKGHLLIVSSSVSNELKGPQEVSFTLIKVLPV